jgi:hypothetical protein
MADTNNKTLEELLKEGKLAARIQLKHNSEQDWRESNFVPLKGEMVLYDINPADKTSVLKLKIGDGVRQQDGSVSGTKVDELPFATISQSEVEALLASYATQADLKAAIGGIEKPDLTLYAKTKFVEDNYTTKGECSAIREDLEIAEGTLTKHTEAIDDLTGSTEQLYQIIDSWPYVVSIIGPSDYSRADGTVDAEVTGGTYAGLCAAFGAGQQVVASYKKQGNMLEEYRLPLSSIDATANVAIFAAEIHDSLDYLVLTLHSDDSATMEMSASHGELSQGLGYAVDQISEHAEAIEELQKEVQPISRGGTGATTATKALDNLGITDRLSALEQLLNSLSPSVPVRVPYSYGDWDYHNDSYTCLITCKLDDFPTGAKNLAKYCTKCAIKNADEIRSFFSRSTGSDNKNYIFAGKIVDATKLVIYLEYPGYTGKEPSIPMTSDTQYAELELSGLNLTRNTSSQLD